MKLPVLTHIRAAIALLVFCQILLFLVSRNTLSADASTPLVPLPAASPLLAGCATPSFAPAMGSPVTVGGDPHFVGVGDYNGDNHLDIVTTEYDDDKVRILLGNGSGQFTNAPQSPVPTGDQPVATAIGDFNGDNKADIAITNQLSHNITILLGNGDGTFAQAANSPIAVGNAPRGIAHGYFNGDAQLDLAVCNGGSDNISILLGNGNGTFTPAAGSPLMAQDAPFHVVTGFFDADANADLAVANLGSGTVAIFLGNGSGGFAPSGSPISVGAFTSFLALADFNGDGKRDLAATNRLSNNVVILLGNGAGAFSQAMGSPYTVGTAPMAVNAGDIN
ncbi:MAG: VCBS repeat-containing protein, partial [Acidobacteria bacterium]|nr:VCBS repeat-containing protein [Acidobacteriota bacterium]